MAASSPYSGNDYNTISTYRPYELPINNIFRAISAQNEFWDAGARRVKAVYDNALNLDLTLEANQQYKKEFMERAQKQLSKLSSMDLSDPSVQRQGFNIFKPLLQDKAILYDNELTKIKNGIISDANSYRTKKLSSTGIEGEGFTERNLAYSLDGFEAFHSKLARDPNMLKKLHEKLGDRKYVPYYDPTKEYASVLRNCRGSSSTSQDIASNYMYFDAFSKTGASSSETANCFMMGLSQKAKEQIGIDGWAYYKGNPKMLADDHRTFALGKYEDQLNGIKGKIAGLKKGTLNEEDKKKLKELEDMLPAVQQEYDKRVEEYNELVGPNAVDYAKKNFQTLSKGIYLNKTYAYLGEAYRSDTTSRKLTANAAGIAQFNAIERMYYQERESENRKEEIRLRYQLDRELKKESGEIPTDLVQRITPITTEGTDTNQKYGSREFNNDKKLAFEALDSAHKSIIEYMKDSDMKITGNEETYILNAIEEHSKKPVEQQDKVFTSLIEAYNRAKDNFSSLDMRGKVIEKIIANEFANDESYQKSMNKVIKLSDGTTFRVADLQNIPQTTERRFLGYGDTGGGSGRNVDYVKSFTINGRTYREGDEDFYKIKQELVKYYDSQKVVAKRRDELHRQQYYNSGAYLSPRVDPNKNNAVNNIIQTSLNGLTGGNNNKGGYKLFGHDVSGKDLYVVPLDENGNMVQGRRLNDYLGTNVDVTKRMIGNTEVLVIPNVLPAVADNPTPQQLKTIGELRNFRTLMEEQLKGKGAFFSSENLRNADGTTFPYGNFSFKTSKGANIQVKAIIANNQISLVPSFQLENGEWDHNYPMFDTPEQLVLHFRNR